MTSASTCLTDLESLVTEKSSEKRRELLHKVTDLFFMTQERQSGADTDIFGDVLERIAFELETDIRSEFSERISHAEKGPRNLVKRLATDDIEVAGPVLQNSTVLTDEDMVEIAREQSQDHLLALTKREKIAEIVSEVIVERGNENVLNNIVKNEGAEFNRQSLEQLTKKTINNQAIQNRLMGRTDIPKDILETIRSNVAEKLKQELALNIGDDEENSAKKQEFDMESEAAQEIEKLQNSDLLDEDVIISYARKRMMNETCLAMAKLTNFEPSIVHSAILQQDQAALAVLCKATGLSRATYSALLQFQIFELRLPSSSAITAMKRYETLDKETAKRVVRFLKVRVATKTA